MTVETLSTTTTKFSLEGTQIKQIQTAIKNLKHSKKDTILHNVKFTVSNYEVVFEAMDYTNHVVLTFPSYTNIEGIVIVNKSVLKELKVNKNDTVVFETENRQLKISNDGMVTYQPLEIEMSSPIAYENGLTFNVNSKYVKSLANALKFVSTAETRPILTGIHHTNNKIVCTDSHQLYKCTDIHTLRKDDKMTVASKTCKMVTGLMKSYKGDILMSVSNDDKYVRYEANNMVITGRLLDGSYPVTDRMFPQYFKTELKLNEKEVLQLTKVIKAMLPYTNKKNNTIKFEISHNRLTVKSLDFKQTKVNDQTVSEHIETATNVIDDINIQGEEMEIAFNGKNMLTALEQQKGESLEIKFVGKTSPFIIVGDSIKDEYLYSPVRIY